MDDRCGVGVVQCGERLVEGGKLGIESETERRQSGKVGDQLAAAALLPRRRELVELAAQRADRVTNILLAQRGGRTYRKIRLARVTHDDLVHAVAIVVGEHAQPWALRNAVKIGETFR